MHGVGNQRGHWMDSASVETTEKSQQIEREMSKRCSKKGGKGEERGGEGGRMRAEREGGDRKSRCYWNWTDRANCVKMERQEGLRTIKEVAGACEKCARGGEGVWSPDQGTKPLYTSTQRMKGTKLHKSLCCPTASLFPSWLPWEIQLPRDFSLHLN